MIAVLFALKGYKMLVKIVGESVFGQALLRPEWNYATSGIKSAAWGSRSIVNRLLQQFSIQLFV